MAIADINLIIRDYLKTCTTLTALIGGAVDPRLYCPRLPENAALPAVSFFSRGGLSTPYIPGIVTPSIQFDCWAEDIVGGLTGPKAARQVYRALYDNLQGIQNVAVGADPPGYQIKSAIEEVQGQDLVDVDIPGYFRTLTFFAIMIRADT